MVEDRQQDTPHPRGEKRRAAVAAVAVIAALGALLWLCGSQSAALRASRMAARKAVGATEGMPPALAFANVALGGFRGVVADLLWLRAQRLQEEGRYVELVPLAEGIASLEPDNGEVWAYHAWNLAFNVCAMMRRPEDRWRWVRAGIDLLERRGARLNPRDARTRRELSWIFLFKLGTDVDRAAWHYRAEWARELAPLLGPHGEPPPPLSPQAEALAERFGLDAGHMAALAERFGPLDWRVPGSHAAYWAAEGVERAGPRERLPCRRALYQSLVQMLREGGRLASPPDEHYDGSRLPNPALLDGTLAFLGETARNHPTLGVRAAYLMLLLDAARMEAARGNPDVARTRYRTFVDAFEPGAALPSPDDVLHGSVAYGSIPWDMLRPFDPAPTAP